MSEEQAPDSWEDIDENPTFKPSLQSSHSDSTNPIIPSSTDEDFLSSTSSTTTTNSPPFGSQQKEEDKSTTDKDSEPYFTLMLLVNYTKLTQGKVKGDGEDEELINELKEEILKDFENQSEKLFSGNFAYHTDSLHWESDLDKLELMFPDDYITFIDYPFNVKGRESGEEESVEVLWKYVNEPTEWECVNIIKCDYLPIVNRGILYKYEMAMALKYLAMEQHGMGKMALAMKQQEEAEGVAAPMNVLDQIIAMIFSRITVYGSEEEHFKKLAEVHEQVREGWIKEFGCLPPDLLWKGTRIN